MDERHAGRILAFLITMESPSTLIEQPALEGAAGTQAHTEAPEQGILGTFGVDGQLFLAQLLNFAIVIFVLSRWVFKPLIKTMDERRQKIEKGLQQASDAERALGDARKTEASIISEARNQAKDIVDEAKEHGEREKQTRIQKSNEIISQQLQESKEQVVLMNEAAKKDVMQEAADLVATVTEKIAPGILDEKKHRKLILQAIEELEQHG